MSKSRSKKEETIKRLNRQIKMARIKSCVDKIIGVIKKKF
jgi:hypothetical protein